MSCLFLSFFTRRVESSPRVMSPSFIGLWWGSKEAELRLQRTRQVWSLLYHELYHSGPAWGMPSESFLGLAESNLQTPGYPLNKSIALLE